MSSVRREIPPGVTRAWVVPWDEQFGIAFETESHDQGGVCVGSEADARHLAGWLNERAQQRPS